ncbi:interferon-induced protein 44-like [Saccostrea echinata]|uniref:interferon-induced protein 44-like n=1 Tax=Saccostrea echinata TaxID=191078 RepID=UPI002A813368|nr:interferon-induced protein 44-like [Saccostrea echinata]
MQKYLEPLKKPWRMISAEVDDPWTSQFKEQLMEKIVNLEPAAGINYFNILLLGQAASGKSSFLNTCATAIEDNNRLITLSQVYQKASKSVTTSLEVFPLHTRNGQILPLRLFDCRGLNVEHGVPTEDVMLIVKGHVRNGYEINPEVSIKKENPKYREIAELKDRMHCVVYVTNAENPSEQLTDPKTEEQLRFVRETIASDHVPQIVLFSKIDKLRISNKDDLRDVFRSQGVRDTCYKAAEYMQIPLMNVLPMSNYHEENLPTLEKDILALFYLLTMMQRANDFVSNCAKVNVPEEFYD